MYLLVTDKGLCKHADGNMLVMCFDMGSDHRIDSESKCRSACTSYSTCIGYMGYFGGRNNGCTLIPSTPNCPGGFTVIPSNGTNKWSTLAATSGDLVPSVASDEFVPKQSVGWACYARMAGKAITP